MNKLDLTGKQYGSLKVLKEVEPIVNEKGKRYSAYLCECECGNKVVVKTDNLQRYKTDCGCKKYLNYIGKEFGYLTVESILSKRKNDRVTVLCKCKCGKYIEPNLHHLITGETRSCGCLRKEYNLTKFKGGGELCALRSIKGAAKRRKLTFEFTDDEVKKMIAKPCYYCGMIGSNKAVSSKGTYIFRYNGLDRVDSTKGYVKGNVVTACKYCNNAKSTMTKEEFYEWLERAYKHIKEVS